MSGIPGGALPVGGNVDSNEGLSVTEREFTDYILGNAKPIDSIDDMTQFSDLEPLRDLAEQSLVCMYGEAHGMVENYRLGLRVFRYLYTLGYRTFILESDWAYSDLFNDFLRTGDEGLIRSMDSWHYPNASNNQDCMDFYRTLYEWNRSLPEGQKISMWGTDVAHGKTATVNKILEGLRHLPDRQVSDELAAQLHRAVESGRTYAGYKQFEREFLEKTHPYADSTRDYEKTALYVRILKDTAAWKEIDEDSDATTAAATAATTVTADYPGVQEIREEASLAIWNYILARHDFRRDGKILFHGGSWHTVLGVKEGVTRRLGVLLNETVPQVAGKVFTINAMTVSGSARVKDGSHKDARELLGRSTMREELCKLPHRWSLVVNNEGVFHPEGTLYSAYIMLKDCTPARSRPDNAGV
jgi:hypothetical protein